MGTIEKKSQPALILGGGRGGSEFVQLLQDVSQFHIVGVVDANPDAPAFKLAIEMHIPIFDDVEKALHSCKPCTAFNFTNDEAVSELAASIVGPCSIIGGTQSHLIWDMFNQIKETRDQLQKNQLFTESIISHAMEGIILIDAHGIIKTFNPAAETMFGFTLQEVLGKNISMLMPDPDKTNHDGYLERYLSTNLARVVGIEREVVAQHKDGVTFPISLSVNEMISDGEHLFVGIVSDISERKKNEEMISKLAHYDVITGLPNRVLFFDRCDKALSHAKRNKMSLAVMFLDLDGFKDVNDTLGHAAGDELLKQVANRMQETIREEDTVARFGGDEFALIFNDVKSRDNIEHIADKIIAAISEPFVIGEDSCNIGASAGVSMFPDDHTEMDSLVRQADTAMYSAKKSGKNHCRFYDENMQPY